MHCVLHRCHFAHTSHPVPYTRTRPSSKTAQTVIEIQKKCPKARIVYCSATGASQPEHIGFVRWSKMLWLAIKRIYRPSRGQRQQSRRFFFFFKPSFLALTCYKTSQTLFVSLFYYPNPARYMDRLGIWGAGTPFPDGFESFLSYISRRCG